jgi:Holliday junction resolvasome RuvABC endonuclease subunit
MGIDPGSEAIGVSLIYFDPITMNIRSVKARTYFGSRLTGRNELLDIHGDRMCRIYKHKDNLINLLQEINPLAVVCESPFINMRMPAAYGALTEVVFMIRQCVLEYSVLTPFYLVEPSNVKKAAGAKGNADKVTVKQSLLQNELLTKVFDGNIRSLDEHSLDAIAVAYSQYLKYTGN